MPERICACPPSPHGPLFTKHAGDCPRRPFAALDHFARSGPTRWSEWPGLVGAGVVVLTGTEYLRCEDCRNIMPLVGVNPDERCHLCGGEYIIEKETKDMQQDENPYRRFGEMRADGEDLFGMAGPRPARSGPGLLGADIDSIARHHHFLGRQEAEGEARIREQAMRAELEQAWDEGFNAGLGSQWRKLADDFVRRLIADVHFPLMAVEEGPKSKMAERLVLVREGVAGLMNYAEELRAAGETPRTPPGERRA